MKKPLNQFNPDYAVPPGWILEEYLEVNGLSPAKFARKCGSSPELISKIIKAKAPVEPETALQFERVLGIDARIWLGIEKNYRLHRARTTEAKDKTAITWAETFPVSILVKRGYIQKPGTSADKISKLLKFFEVGSINALEAGYGLKNVIYRHSPKFKSDKVALATWIRLGQIEAASQDCSKYNKTRFSHAVRDIPRLTNQPIIEALQRVEKLCNEAGVALTIVQPLPKTALCGAAWWLSPQKAVIQLTARHKTDDHLWFTFFHEAAHILRHSKKSVFVDDTQGNDSKLEKETDEWAADMLIPQRAWKEFTDVSCFSEADIRVFAEQQGIAPGIVVGRLQHHKLIPWNRLNRLKVKLKWNKPD